MNTRDTVSEPDVLASSLEIEALERLDAVVGMAGLKAVMLAMLLHDDDPRRMRVWREETALVQEAETIRIDFEALGRSCRMPWFEEVLVRLSGSALHDRQALLVSARKVMSASRRLGAMDRLLWLVIRHAFGETLSRITHAVEGSGLDKLNKRERQQVERFSAHLARLVPDAAGLLANEPTDRGLQWHLAIAREINPGQPPSTWYRQDVDALVQSLAALQSLAARQRAALMDLWVGHAIRVHPQRTLSPPASDALRLAALLLDTPMPPALAHFYIAVEDA